MDVMTGLKPIGEVYRAGDLEWCLEQIRFLWSQISEPKADVLNAYLVVEYGARIALEHGDLEEAGYWAAQAPQFASVRQDMGEVELLVGKVAYECGDIDRAREQFRIANLKSEGRMFEDVDPKYSQLIR